MTPLNASKILFTHSPQSPQSNDEVTITASPSGPPFPSQLWLHYQVVKPGHYIALSDAKFATDWKSVELSDNGTQGDSVSHDGIFSRTLTKNLQRHRHLIRYFVTQESQFTAEDLKRDQTKAYFVYDGVPNYVAAVNPRSKDRRYSTPKQFTKEALTRVPVYHLISKRSWIEEATWKPRRRGYQPTNDQHYEHTGTFVYEGKVYDHIQFRARGGAWRHAMGKNMWKINFRSKQPFHVSDNFGEPYRAPWDKLNLGACIQQGQYGMRGEHGMFDALSYRLFNLAGTPAPRTHWIHFRIIDDERESTESQYEGDFWGLYLAVENIDSAFLQEHALAQGNLYKIENFQAHERYLGMPFHSPISNPNQFIRTLSRGRPDRDWWKTRVDLDRYNRYRSIVECVRHYDISHGKNYFFFYDGAQSKWLQIPWDVDLTWGEHMYGSGKDPFLRAQVFRNAEQQAAYQYQLREIRDLLFNEATMKRLIEDHAAIIDPPEDMNSLADADRAMWDFHPVMNSRYSMARQAGQGQFYFRQIDGTFRNIVAYMHDFVGKRSAWIDKNLLRGFQPGKSPLLSMEETDETVRLSATTDATTIERWEWRMAPIQSQDFRKRQAPSYEIEGRILERRSSDTLTVGRAELADESFRFRVRGVRSDGSRTPWSKPINF